MQFRQTKLIAFLQSYISFHQLTLKNITSSQISIIRGQKPLELPKLPTSLIMVPFLNDFSVFYCIFIYNMKIYSEMDDGNIQNLFEQSTNSFSEGNYSSALKQITKCIYLQPHNSIFYSNRAIINYRLKSHNLSFRELQHSINIDHLNYIAYFNIFSLKLIHHQLEEAFQNLCLCLSSAYTVLNKVRKNKEELEIAIKYSDNNKEAIFMLAMILFQKQSLEQAQSLIISAASLENRSQQRQMFIKIAQIIQSKMGKDRKSIRTICFKDTKYYKLKTNLRLGENKTEIIKDMVEEFNYVYNLINSYKTEAANNKIDQKKSYLIPEIQPSNDSLQTSNQKTTKQINEITWYEETKQYRETHNAKEQSEQVKSISSISDKIDKNYKFLDLNSRVRDSFEKQIQIFSEHEDFIEKKSNIAEFAKIYPLVHSQQKVKFFINSFSIKTRSDEEVNKLISVYAIISYNQKANAKKVRTAISKIVNRKCFWNQESEPFFVTQNPSEMKIKVYNKSYTSFRDDCLGQIMIDLDSLGPLKLPTYDGKGNETGQILLNLNLVL